jgi:hypothetical protein
MSYKQVLTKAQSAPSLVTIERHGVPNVSGRVLSLDADGATIQTKAEAEVYIEFASMRGVTNDGWDADTLAGD